MHLNLKHIYIYINKYIITHQHLQMGCQMVPKGCQFTIRWGLIGTPLKVLGYLGYTVHVSHMVLNALPVNRGKDFRKK